MIKDKGIDHIMQRIAAALMGKEVSGAVVKTNPEIETRSVKKQ